ncbi:bifunctional 3-oxoadipate enol-lactonase/4-carboxymuconolactone decarboxylase PcaDC [Aeromicrobium massiliense]|uniref:bifunctional 3-oxoadipate enol-lactonase/4-carboxymuconolactone decarboxylase PcaDC n=1 Tax=Aeromicrobium massiliense TaxID=1464554 RepID=UPI0003185EEA|nr:4-carboxymuconolactone decarboxylase [Aeromicrobium massiliense]
MTDLRLTAVQLSEPGSGPLLVLGPSLGTSVEALWAPVVSRLADSFHLVGWDLPGHGRSEAPAGTFSVADLAAAVLDVVDRAAGPGAPFAYAGVSLGGAVGLQLLLDAPDRVTSAAVLCTGAKIGTAESWAERAEQVRSSGTPRMVEGSAKRWFAPGFIERKPERTTALLHSLQDADSEGYSLACEALAAFDVRDRLGEIATPVLAVAGSADEPTPPASLAEIADGVQSGRLVVLDDVAHLAPAENPDAVAALLQAHLQTTDADRHASGMKVRRAVLGDAHVDRANAGIIDLTREFQDMITRYAWGEIWTRPGLQRRDRSLITMTALVALGHHEELAMHVRAARRNGLSVDEIKELLLQTAIYCGVPAANTAFRIATQALADEE